MAPALEIKLEIQLDPDDTGKEITRYFPGDLILGRILLTSNQTHTLKNFRLAWTGRIQVQPIQSNKESRTYFDECWKLSSLTKTSLKKPTTYQTELSLIATSEPEPVLELSKNKTVALMFTLAVPNDRPLPSFCEKGLNKIIYLLEAFVDEKPTFFTQKTIPVYEVVYTRTPDMTVPQRKEQVFMVSLNDRQPEEFTSAMRVTLPCRGAVPGIAIPVSISIWNNMEFSRRQGISVSLFRTNQVIANGRTYTSQGEKIHRVVTDLNITTSEENQSQKVQTVRINIPIPRGTLPTLSIETSQLLAVEYFIRVQVFAQEGIYTTSEGSRSQFMMLDLPFVIGTQSTPISPTLSHSSFNDSILRKSSVTSSEKKKKKNVFSNLRFYSLKKNSGDTGSSNQISATVVMTPKTKDVTPKTEPLPQQQGGVFDLFINDDIESVHQTEVNTETELETIATETLTTETIATETLTTETITEAEVENKPEIEELNIKVSKMDIFNLMSEDDDDDDEDEEEEVIQTRIISLESERKTNQIEQNQNTSKPQQQSNVFKMFDDDDSDDDEEQQVEILQHQTVMKDERVKPNQ